MEQQRISHANATREREVYPVEKSDADMSHIPHYRAPESPAGSDPDLVSPIVASYPHSAGSGTISGQTSPTNTAFTSSSPSSPPPTYQRINHGLQASNVVYAGPLPDHVRIPGIVSEVGGGIGTNSSLGSAFTEHESDDLYGSGSGSAHIVSPVAASSGSHPTSHTTGSNSSDPVSSLSGSGSGSEGPQTSPTQLSEDTTLHRNMPSLDPWGSRRRLDGEDLVHVPQPAENRFSWEEERI